MTRTTETRYKDQQNRIPIAITGSYAHINPQFTNSTFHLDFHGPAVHYAPANDSIVRKRTADFGTNNRYGRGFSVTLFASWTGPYISDHHNGGSIEYDEFYDFDLDYTSEDAARLFVMTNLGTHAWDNYLKTNESEESWNRIVNVTECLLQDATYSVDFIFREGMQNLNVNISEWHAPVPLSPTSWEGPKVKAYAAIMQAFGTLLIGTFGDSTTAEVLPADSSSTRKMLDIDWDDTNLFQ